MNTLLTFFFAGLLCQAPDEVGNVDFEIKLGNLAIAALDQAPDGSRLVIFLDRTGPGTTTRLANRPFWIDHSHLASWSLDDSSVELDLVEGRLRVGTPEMVHGDPPSELQGVYAIQAMIDVAGTRAGHDQPGDLYGPPIRRELEAGADQTVELLVDRILDESPVEKGLIEVELESRILPSVSGMPGMHRAWVALPMGYDNIRAARRVWPTVYFIPDHGSALDAANSIARLLQRPEMKRIMPQAIWVILDPIGRHGHHYFMDSPANGARSRALIEELIPWLEVRFRAIPEKKARLLHGHGAGGRAALDLLVEQRDHFAMAAAVSPELVTFNSAGTLNLYKDENAFVTPEGTPRNALRSPLGPERDRLHTSIEDQVSAARAINPGGRSGMPWDAMRSAFGTVLEEDGSSPWPFDPESGVLRPEIVAGWKRKDLVLTALASQEVADLLRTKAIIFVGSRDQRHREQGVISLEAVLGPDRDDEQGHGSLEILPGATAEEVSAAARLRTFDALVEHLKENGLHD